MLCNIILTFHPSSGYPLKEFCEWDTFDPKCNDDEVVLVEQATFGRMHTGTCIKDNRDIGCFYDVTNIAHRKCSGRHSCQITVPDRDLDATQPCGEMKNYLQISNTCIKGIHSDEVKITLNSFLCHLKGYIFWFSKKSTHQNGYRIPKWFLLLSFWCDCDYFYQNKVLGYITNNYPKANDFQITRVLLVSNLSVYFFHLSVEQGTGRTSCRSCDYITVSGPAGHISSAVTQVICSQWWNKI